MSERKYQIHEAENTLVGRDESEVKVSEAIDLGEILVDLGGDQSLKALAENFEKLAFTDDGEVSDNVKSSAAVKAVVKTLSALRLAVDNLEESTIVGSLTGEMPEGITTDDNETAIQAIGVVRNLIFTYISKLESELDFDDEQQETLGLKKEIEESDPEDLVSFKTQWDSVRQKMEDDGSYNPSAKPGEVGGEEQSDIDFLNGKIDQFRQIYVVEGSPEQRIEVLRLIEAYIRPAELLVLRLVDRVNSLEEKRLTEWRDGSEEYKNLTDEIGILEGNSADGSEDLSAKITRLKELKDLFVAALEAQEFTSEDEFSGVLENYWGVLSKLQVGHYLFLTKELREEIKKAEEMDKRAIDKLSVPEKQKIVTKLEELRGKGADDVLNGIFFAKNVSEVLGEISEKAQEEAGKVADGLKKRIDHIRENQLRLPNLEDDIIVANLRRQDLQTLIRSWHTNDLDAGSDPRMALEIVFGEKLELLEQDFVDKALAVGETREVGLERFENFKALYESVYGLVWLGVLNSNGLNTLQGTAKHEAILQSTKISSTMGANVEFNLNPIVGAAVEGMNQGEMYMDSHKRKEGTPEEETVEMGVVQMIVFAAFQRMKTKYGDYTRNQSFKAGLMQQMIEEVCAEEDVVMWNGEKASDYEGIGKQVNIKEELEKFPEEVQEIIKMFAIWKLCRDDAGSKAGIWHWGKNKGAFKFGDGVSDKQADGFLAGQCYQVGKNSKNQGHLASLGFITPENTHFMRKDGDRGLGDHPDGYYGHDNDSDILEGTELVDRYLLYAFPQLRGVWYDENVPEHGSIGANHKYSPENWWEDFPGLDHFFNRTDTVYTSEDYDKSKDAVMQAIQLALSSLYFDIPRDLHALETFLVKKIGSFNTQIGRMLAYVGKFNDHSAGYTNDDTEYGKINELNYVNEVMLAAYKFFIMNILIRIPTSKNPNRRIPFASKSQPPKILEVHDPAYYSRYRKALEVIEKMIGRNSTLEPFFQKELVGIFKHPADGAGHHHEIPRPDGSSDIPFLELPFQAVYRDEVRLANEYNEFLIHHEHLGFLDALKQSNAVPSSPWAFSPGEPWAAIEGAEH